MNNRFTINGTNPDFDRQTLSQQEDEIVRDMLDKMKGLETQLDRSKAAHDTFMEEHRLRREKHAKEMARLDRQWRWLSQDPSDESELKVFMTISVTTLVISFLFLLAITIWKTL